ncbi:DUF1653 domain-containing protein [Solobacterium moorei]|uniref:DUF1653 domain-containing protein n=1 Tax=Solobacterium moorei F0204 TaxID=706433 RepID=E7MP39_9FIRM|nr:DUF1653 domain-containing protein [Solobacterium moorei]EFW24220.1 hypothetical protein HMPREF9430_01311 [Solobacterium moorei F0204]MDI6414957.1 DUF1653 domain-containing protein [Solobacterium moorei]BET20976.1 hypothetical protein RGT18_05640 [Solobacterium moorei]
MRKFASGDIIQHFKRETVDQNSMQYLYEYIGVAMHSETRDRMIVYRALYGEKGLFVRPYEMFMEEVDHEKYPEIRQKYRFEKTLK